MYLFVAHYINMETDKERTKAIEIEGQFFDSEKTYINMQWALLLMVSRITNVSIIWNLLHVKEVYYYD